MSDFSVWLQSEHALNDLNENEFNECKQDIIEFFGGIKNMIQICMDCKQSSYLENKQLQAIAMNDLNNENNNINKNGNSLLSLHNDSLLIIFQFLNKTDHCSLMNTCTELLYIGRLPLSINMNDNKLNSKKLKFIGNGIDNQSIEWIMHNDKTKNLKGIKHLTKKYYAEISKSNYTPVFDIKLLPFIIRNCNRQNLKSNYLLSSLSLKLLSYISSICSVNEYVHYLTYNNDKFNFWKMIDDFIKYSKTKNDAQLYEIIITTLESLLINNKDQWAFQHRNRYYKTHQEVLRKISFLNEEYISNIIEYIINECLKDLKEYKTCIKFVCYDMAILQLLILFNHKNNKHLDTTTSKNVFNLCIESIKYLYFYFTKNWRDTLNVGDEIYSKTEVELYQQRMQQQSYNYDQSIRAFGCTVIKVNKNNLNEDITMKIEDKYITISRYDESLLKLYDIITSSIFYNAFSLLLHLKKYYHFNINFEEIKISKYIKNLLDIPYIFGTSRHDFIDRTIQPLPIEVDYRILNQILKSKHKTIIFDNCINTIFKVIPQTINMEPNIYDIFNNIVISEHEIGIVPNFNAYDGYNCSFEPKEITNIMYHAVNFIDKYWHKMSEIKKSKLLIWISEKLIYELDILQYFDELNGIKCIENVLSHIKNGKQSQNNSNTINNDNNYNHDISQNQIVINNLKTCVITLTAIMKTVQTVNSDLMKKCKSILAKYYDILDIESANIMLTMKHSNNEFINDITKYNSQILIDIINKSFHETTKERGHYNPFSDEPYIDCLLHISLNGNQTTRDILINNNFLESLYNYWLTQNTNLKDIDSESQILGYHDVVNYDDDDKSDSKYESKNHKFWKYQLKMFQQCYLKQYSLDLICKNVTRIQWFNHLKKIKLPIAETILMTYFDEHENYESIQLIDDDHIINID